MSAFGTPSTGRLSQRSHSFCLAEAGIIQGQVNRMTINQDGKAKPGKKLTNTITKLSDFGTVLDGYYKTHAYVLIGYQSRVFALFLY